MKLSKVLTAVVGAIVTATLIGGATAIIANRSRITALESTTVPRVEVQSSDRELREWTTARAESLREWTLKRDETLRTWLEARTPPEWLRSQISEMRTEFRADVGVVKSTQVQILQQLKAVETRLDRIEG